MRVFVTWMLASGALQQLFAAVYAQDDGCQMCESADAVLRNPDKIIPFLGESGQINPTCQAVFDFAPSVPVTDDETCSLIQGQAAFCGCPESSSEPINACTLCPLGADSLPGAPDYVAPYGGTCGELNEYISFMPQTECNKFDRSDLLLANNFICKCPNATVACSLCPDETVDMDNPDLVIPYFAIPDNDKPTCVEARDFASVRDVAECKLYKNNAGYCGCPTTRSGEPAVPLDVCGLCPDGSAPTKPDLITPSGDKCSDLQLFMSYLDEEACEATTAGLIQANAFICGCPGVEEPICEFCGAGFEISDPDDLANDGNATCGDAELAVWTAPKNLCEARESSIQIGRDACCVSGAVSISYFAMGWIAAAIGGLLLIQ